MTEDQGGGKRFCHNCGAELPHVTSHFCQNCGAAQDPGEAVEAGYSPRVPYVPPITINLTQEQKFNQEQQQAQGQAQRRYGCGYGCLALLAVFFVIGLVGSLLETRGGAVALVLLVVGGVLIWLQIKHPQVLKDFVARFRRSDSSTERDPSTEHDPNYGRQYDPSAAETNRPDDEPPTGN